MAKDFMSLDCGFPNFAEDVPIEEKVSKLYNYTFMLLESLRYLLRNLDADNFNAVALADFKKAYEDKVNYAIADLETEVNENFARAELFTEFKTATEGALQNQTDALSKFETEVSKDYAKIAGLAEYEAIKSIDGKVKENTAAIAGVKETADGNAAELIEIAEWKGTKYQTFAEGLAAAEAAAKDAAKDYTDGKVTEAKADIESKVYTKSEATAEFAAKKDFVSYQSTVTQKFSEADTAAKGYAEDAGTDAENAAKGYTDGKVTELSESFSEIEQKADANGAFIKLMVGQAVKLVGGDLKGVDDNQAVTSASAADFVMEAANGESTIKLRADRIKLGEGAGVYGDGNLYLCRLFGPSNVASGSYPGQFYLEVDSSFNFSEDSVGADMLMKSVSSIDSYTGTKAVMYGFRYGSTKGNEGTSSVNFVVAAGTDGSEKSVIGYNYNQDKVYPKGAWDFDNADVSGLVVRFS